jgi:phosphate transport system protein
MRKHLDRDYEADLQKLREDLLLMGARVEEMIASSMQALSKRDSGLAERTVLIDRQINRLEMEIDEHCLVILARRQPVASDLRFITTALKLVTDLERVGDLGVNICERVIELNEEEPLKPYVDLVNMAEAAQGMLRDGLDAFVAGDMERAHAVISRDGEVDAYYKSIFRDLLTYMMENPRNIFRATRVQSIAKYIERIADHATNVAELVVFMVRGKDIRHVGKTLRWPHAHSRASSRQRVGPSVRDVRDAKTVAAWARCRARCRARRVSLVEAVPKGHHARGRVPAHCQAPHPRGRTRNVRIPRDRSAVGELHPLQCAEGSACTGESGLPGKRKGERAQRADGLGCIR